MKKLKVVISLMMEENHYQKQHAGAAHDVARRLGIDLQILYAGNDAITQSEQLLKIIQFPSKGSRPDGIICFPVGTTLLQVARQAAAAGIGWVVLNRECDYMEELRRSFHVPIFSVGADQPEIGRIQARQIERLLPEGGLILYVLGPTVSSSAQLRSTWLQFTKPGNVQVRTLTGDWSQQSGYNAVSKWLQLRTSQASTVGLVAAQNDDMAMGARKAFENHTTGEERECWMNLPYIGVDCCPDAGEEWVRKGFLTASIVNPPTTGIALEMLVHALQTKSQPSERTQVAPTSYPLIEKLFRTASRKGAS